MAIEVTRARIDDFDYGSARYSHFRSSGWDAYATDIFQAHFRP